MADLNNPVEAQAHGNQVDTLRVLSSYGDMPSPENTKELSTSPYTIKVLNLYAGIGGNRKLWENVEVTAVESEQYIADVYKHFFPNDTVIVGDAHQYLIDHFKEFDFIWSSPPCPTHSKMNSALSGWNIYRYPDMALYQEIIFLKHWFKGDWLVENVESYYNPLITPTTTFDRHYFWSNFYIPTMLTGRNYNVTKTKKEDAAAHLGFELPEGTKNQRKLLRNAVDPKMGLHIFNAAQKHRSRTEGNDLVALDLEVI